MLSFLILIIGLMSEYRIFSKFWEEKIIRKEQMKFFFLLFFILSFVISILFQKKPFLVWFVMLIANLLSFFVPFIIQKRRKNDFQRESIVLMDKIISSVKSGSSFRDTLKSLQDKNGTQSYYFSEIFQAIFLDQSPERISSDAQVQRLYFEMKQITGNPHRIADRLVALRRTLKTEAWFAQKTKQALLQSRAQSLIMTVLYLALFFFVFWSGQLKGNSDIILISILLYSIGTFWVWKMGRGYRWKA